MSENAEMLSLFDYLGKPSGKELGGEVVKAAMAHSNYIPIKRRYVSTKFYNGEVNLFPKEFLNEYFNKSTSSTTTNNDDLPF